MSVQKSKKEGQVEIKKHVNTIHSSNNISLVQRKVFNVLLYNAYEDLPKKSQFTIAVKILAALIGYDSNDQKKLKNSLMGLITTAIEWNVLNNSDIDSSKWIASSIIAAAKIERGICTYEFSSVMRELLYHPERYGRIDMNIMTKFKSSYGLALYENCIRFQGLSTTGWITLDVFRKLMGVSEGKYLAFCDFKKRILDIAIKEVNEYTHLNVAFEAERVGKKVTSLRFNFLENAGKMIHVEHISHGHDGYKSVLSSDFGLSLKLIDEISSKYEEAFIQEKIQLIQDSDNFKLGKIRDLSAYLMDSLKRDYKKGNPSKAASKKIQQSKLEDATQKERALEEKNKRYSKYVHDFVGNHMLSLKENAKAKLLNSFEASCDPYTLSKYKKHGLKNKIVRAIFNMFMKNNVIFKKSKMLSFEEYILHS